MVASQLFIRRVSPRTVFILLLALGLALLAPPADAAIINVTAGAVDTTVNGNCSLIEAIQSANTDAAVDACTAGTGFDIIIVPAGTYTLTTVFAAGGGSDGADIGLPLIATAMRLDGASAATTIIERDLAAPAFRLFDVSGAGDLGLRFLTVRNGLSFNGAAVRVNSMSPNPFSTSQSVFDNNVATFNGGAIIFATPFPPPMSPNIVGTSFTNNSATTGGAIRVEIGANPLIEDSTFTGNSATADGGAIFTNLGPLVCTRCVFTANDANNGGAMLVVGDLTLTDSLVSGNTAANLGGGLFATSGAGVIQIAGTTFSGNTANVDFAGVLFANAVTATVVNSTVSGNMAGGSIGGIGTLNTATLTLNNVTITANTAVTAAGGLGPTGGTVIFANTIIAGNMAATGPDCFPTGGATFTSMGFNLVGNNADCGFAPMTGDQVGTGGAPINPLLGALANNGGPTAGATPTAIPTHFPQPGSPALDAGNNVAAPGSGFPACEADDQIDVARPLGPRCDIGAIESIASADVSIDKADNPDPVAEGANIVYTFTVTNNGPNNATDVELTDTFPASLTGVGFTLAPSQGICIFGFVSPATLTCNFGTILNGVTVTVAVELTTTAASVPLVSNTATVTTTSNDPNLADNSDTEDTVVSIAADLTVTKTDSADPARLGDLLTYTVTITNNGPSAATGVSLMDTLPGGVTFGMVTPSQGMCAQAAGLVTCNLGNLAVLANATVTITVTPTAAGVITNTADVSSNEIDPNTADNTVMEGTEVVDFTIAATPPSVTVTRGNGAVYTVTYTPVGSSFPFAITQSCTGLPAFSSCLFQTNPVTPNAAPVNVTLVITTQAPIFARNGSSRSSPFLAFGLGLPLFFLGAMLMGPPSRRKHWRTGLALALLLVVLLLNFGCAHGELPANAAGTPTGTFTITVTGTSGALSHSTTVDLVVQ